MPRNRKYLPHNTVVLLSARIEEGLPLPPNYLINHIVWGVLAEARSRYRIRICHFVFMANHFHMLVVVDDPEAVPAFMRYVKAELAHAINRLLGRFKRTIWAEGYDSPIILTLDKVIHYIKYIYLNPVKANLVAEARDYPGVSSWQMFQAGTYTRKSARIPRAEINPLARTTITIAEQKDLVRRYELLNLEPKEFILEPWAWLECFPGLNRESIKEEIFDGISKDEQYYRKQRREKGIEVVGKTALRRQSMLKPHIPKKRSRRMIVLCGDIDLRKAFIAHFKYLSFRARQAYQVWKKGELSVRIPPGMFAPALPNLASALRI